ncbi:hypothetical protein HDZ31DRAFT_69534 [Schizophyllum fasciatum]
MKHAVHRDPVTHLFHCPCGAPRHARSNGRRLRYLCERRKHPTRGEVGSTPDSDVEGGGESGTDSNGGDEDTDRDCSGEDAEDEDYASTDTDVGEADTRPIIISSSPLPEPIRRNSLRSALPRTALRPALPSRTRTANQREGPTQSASARKYEGPPANNARAGTRELEVPSYIGARRGRPSCLSSAPGPKAARGVEMAGSSTSAVGTLGSSRSAGVVHWAGRTATKRKASSPAVDARRAKKGKIGGSRSESESEAETMEKLERKVSKLRKRVQKERLRKEKQSLTEELENLRRAHASGQ